MKSILTFITAMLAAVLLIPAASAQSTSNPKTQVRVTLDKLSLYTHDITASQDALIEAVISSPRRTIRGPCPSRRGGRILKCLSRWKLLQCPNPATLIP